MKELAKMFGSEARVKLMRLFLLNEIQPFDSEMLAKRIRVNRSTVAREAKLLQTVGFLRKKIFSKEIMRRSKKSKRKTNGWYLNSEFDYNDSLLGLLVEEEFLNKKELVHRLRPAGKIKLFIVSGIFMKEHDPKQQVDMLIVGDNLRKNWIEDTIRKLEAEIGKELAYAVFDTQEFKYRVEMYDKLVRDILDFPHERLIDALPLSTLEFKNS